MKLAPLPLALLLLTSALAQEATSQAALRVLSTPSDASVFVRYPAEDRRDRFVGRTPREGLLELELDAGPAEVVIVKEGYLAKVSPLSLSPGAAAQVEVRLVPDVEVPREIKLHGTRAFVSSAEEAEDLYMTALAQVLGFYVERVDPRQLVDRSLRTLVDTLNAIRAREQLLRRELSDEARTRYYGQEVDLRSYPPLALERGPLTAAGGRSYRLSAGTVAVEGMTDAASVETYLRMLWQGYMFVRRQWDRLDLLTPSMLTRCLVEGVVVGLDDEYSQFLGPGAIEELSSENEGVFGGVGLLVAVREGRLSVVMVVPDTPAARAGVASGDQIVAIDGQRTSRMPLRKAVDTMRGRVGTPVELTLFRPDQGERTVSLVRTKVRLRSTAARLLPDGVGYLRISSFMQDDLHEEVDELLKQLYQEGARRFVLDLRNNPGGLLEQAHAIADLFVSEGRIVSTRTRIPSEAQRLDASSDTPWEKARLIVLINENSASAAEILAGALQDKRRAKLVGVKTYGKGSVQRIIPLGSLPCALALTVATYHLPSGRTPHRVGVSPDREVVLSDADALTVLFRSNYTVDDEPIDPQLAAAIAELSR